jgi:hypothetical protein
VEWTAARVFLSVLARECAARLAPCEDVAAIVAPKPAPSPFPLAGEVAPQARVRAARATIRGAVSVRHPASPSAA